MLNIAPPLRDFPAEAQSYEALDRTAIAELSAETINRMSPDELVRLICASDLSTLRRSDLLDRLALYDRDALVRLAYLARRCCQNQGY